MQNESVLDHPKDDLDSSVWENINGEYCLTQDAENKINTVASWVISKTGIDNLKLHITGSITSNQYSEKSDVDLHFQSDDIDDQEFLNKTIRKEFQESFKPDQIRIGSHPIEIYFQSNPYQDFMSIGCYDFFGKEWLVGPEFISQDYDAYSEYYEDDMKHINSVIDDIRGVILEVYEILIILSNSDDKDFIDYECNKLVDKLAKASSIFTRAREFRKIYSSPSSRDDALKMRASRDWKVADSAFKLLDKFGYLGILREMTTAYEDIQDGNCKVTDVIQKIIDIIQKNIMQNPELQNVDKQLFEGMQTEGFAKTAALVAMIASMLNVSGVTNEHKLEQNLKEIPVEQFNIRSQQVVQAYNDSAFENRTYGGWTFANLTNLVSTITYNEGMLDYIKPNAKGQKYDDRILQAIIWTIITRAGGNPDNFAEEILRPSQYYSRKHVVGNNNDNYRLYHPGVGYSKKTWDKCNEFAVLAIKGKLPMPKDDNGVEFGRRNMIANPEKDAKSALLIWGDDCDWTVGGKTLHKYGYDPSQDGYRKRNTSKTKSKDTSNQKSTSNRIYKVVKGDNLTSIAKKLKTTPKELMSKNTNIPDLNKLSIGQKLKY